jgi:transcriptional antiterminator NusG
MMTDENMNQEVVEETDAAAVAEAETEVVDVAVEAEAVAVDAPVEAEAEAEAEAEVDAVAVDAPVEPEAAAVEPAAEESATEESAVEAEPVEVNPNFKWYVIHTYSGYENRAKQSLEERIRQEDMVNDFGEVLIPTENVIELGKGGQKKTTKRKFFPGYMLVQMDLNEYTWHLVRGTPKVTGFVGGTIKPPAIPEIEVRRLTQQIDEGALQTTPRIHFEYGENVRVVDGAFQNFNGVVEAVDDDKAKVKVMVSIFGRSTPVELDFIQVEKA